MSVSLYKCGWADHSFVGYAWYDTLVSGHKTLQEAFFIQDGDILKILTDTETLRTCQRDDLNIAVATYPNLIIRARGTGGFKIYVWCSVLAAWVTAINQASSPSAFTVFSQDLTGMATTVTKVKIECNGGAGKQLEVDFIAFHSGTALTISIRHPITFTQAKDQVIKTISDSADIVEDLGESESKYDLVTRVKSGSDWATIGGLLVDADAIYLTSPFYDTIIFLDDIEFNVRGGVPALRDLTIIALKNSQIV